MPRRCAPRNDMQKHAACPHRQGRCTRQNCHRLRTFPRVPPPCIRWRVPVFCMSLRTSAHTGVAIRVPAGKGNDKCAFGRICRRLRIRLRYCFLRCCAARRTDCHVAALLAMTCRNMRRVRIGKDVVPGKTATVYALSLASHRLAFAGAYPSFACHCEPVRTLVWQSASPQGKATINALLGEFVAFFVFAQSTAFCDVVLQGERIATSLRSSQ